MAVSNEDMLAMARKLPIPVPWDRDVFIANIAAQRGRPIHLIPTDTAALADQGYVPATNPETKVRLGTNGTKSERGGQIATTPSMGEMTKTNEMGTSSDRRGKW